jgi:hypothetical protein
MREKGERRERKERGEEREGCDKWLWSDSEEFCSKDLNFNILNISKNCRFGKSEISPGFFNSFSNKK